MTARFDLGARRHARFSFAFGAFAWASTLGAATATAETLPIEGVYPAGNDVLAALNTLDFGPFSGREGPTLAIELEQRLGAARVRGASYFTLGPARGGVDGLITGSAAARSETRHEMGQQQECVARNGNGKCTQTRWVKVSCTRRNISLTYTLAVTGKRRERLFAIARTATDSILICPESGPVAPVDVVIAGLVAGVANELRMQFAPLERREDIRVKEGTEGLQGAAKSRFKDGIRATKRNVATACGLWREVDRLVPDHAPTLFNLGLCAESLRDYQAAEGFYRRVADINRSETYAVEAIKRLDLRRHAERQIATHTGRGRR